MKELRTVTIAFTGTPTENRRIQNIVKTLDVNKSEYMRELVLKDIAKREKKQG